LLVDQGSEGPCCVGAHAGQDVLVGVDRERGVGVPEAFGHDLDWSAGCGE
jgi:hypothetical protein